MSFVRDVAIIILAIESIVIGGVLIVLVFEVISLIRLLQNEIKPILNSADETMRTMRGTTNFVSDTLVRPVVRASSFAAGVSQALRILVGRKR